MNFIPYKRLTFKSSINKVDFKNNLTCLLNSSKSENIFKVMGNDFSMRGNISEEGFEIEKRFEGRSPINFKIVGKIDYNNCLNISVTIKPKLMGIIFSLFFVCFSFYFTQKYTIPLLAAIFIYIVSIISFKFYANWAKDLFEKKLLIRNL